MSEIIKSVKSDKIKFNCIGCGNCCCGTTGYIWLTEKEQKDIADYLKLDIKVFLKKYTIKAENKISLKEIKKEENNYWCIFLNEKMQCDIYNVRPHQCKAYPFWESIIENDEYLDFVLDDCPGTELNKSY